LIRRLEGSMQLRLIILLLIGKLIGSISCQPEEVKEETGSLKLAFTAGFGQEKFQLVSPYTYGKQSIKLSQVDFYLTGIELLAAGEVFPLDPVGLIEINNTNGKSQELVISGIPIKDYTGIRFRIGVIPALNSKFPKDFPSSNPLSNNSHHWDAWDSYIFSKIEGVLDTAGKGLYELGFAIHTGTLECLQELKWDRSIQIKRDETFSLDWTIDIKKFFETPAGLFDLVRSPLNHNPANMPVLKAFSVQMARAIQLKN
jgi:hypothetical protein